MHAIDTDGSVSGAFSDGNPSAIPPVEPTEVRQDWFNDVQGNLLRVLADAGISPVKLNLLQLSAAISVLSVISGSGKSSRNLLDNSDFWLWQRAPTGGTSAGAALYIADRWLAYGGGGSGSVDLSPAQVILGTGPEANAINDRLDNVGANYLRWHQTVAASTNTPQFEQRNCELLGSLAGKPVTISFWAKLNTGSTPVAVAAEFEQNFGTGGSPSSEVITFGAAFTVGVAWTRFTATVVLPSVAGKTIGSSTPSYLTMRIRMPVGSTYDLAFGWFDMKPVAAPSAYMHPGIVADWLECSRYYFKTHERGTAVASTSAIGTLNSEEDGTEAVGLSTRFPVEMFAVPTITWHAKSTGAAGKVDRGGTAISVTGTVGTSRRSTGYPQTSSQSLVLGQCHVEAECEL